MNRKRIKNVAKEIWASEFGFAVALLGFIVILTAVTVAIR
ncbi:MAG: hypothetical protein UU77_C0023G0015 [candidate division WWE3 bacterium GW2011_GWC1_41_7]|uniref:Uncharacterized protein n=3 Tax=Katanobacteria TaxID=422282 RepID=A0A0G0ZEY5_UNCKA|nr:MAG: hypothetical protein UU72_C0005G0004 [candidate division WWE3 bacterium GW2011_GWB1_41_6]KKS20591.1 MAG: hypothetical protein UU77_C0023G0015 [candidate division WWE3 bacterium GW2011_GWC1_41_7]KKS22349.1 MAG: hypothetical protein UU80_C0008G0004 [candidate division WWE3 bacterium GW2011_GWA1_41_8]